MFNPKYLVSTTNLVNYLKSIAPSDPGAKMHVTVYSDAHNGDNLQHVTDSSWMELDGVDFVCDFDFYGEFAPFTKAYIRRAVVHSRRW